MGQTIKTMLCLVVCSAIIGHAMPSTHTLSRSLMWSNECSIPADTKLAGDKVKVKLDSKKLVFEKVSEDAAIPDYTMDDATRPWIKPECVKVIEEVDIQAGITGIGNYAFNGLTNLATVTTGTNVVKVGASAFLGCEKLKAITLPAATTVGASAFEGCKLLAAATLEAATEFGEKAFFGCEALATPTFAKLTKIGKSAFEGCAAMTSFTGAVVTEVGDRAFFGDEKLATAAVLLRRLPQSVNPRSRDARL